MPVTRMRCTENDKGVKDRVVTRLVFCMCEYTCVCYWFRLMILGAVSGHMGSSTSACLGRKKQRRGPETAGESLIGIRAEPPQQGSRPLSCSSGPWDEPGDLKGANPQRM